MDGRLKSARQQAAMKEMDAEIENVRVAWNWAVAQSQVELLDQGMESLGLFYLWRQRHQEGEFAFQKAAERLTAMIEQSPGKGQPTASQWTRRVLIKILTWQSAFRSERTESTPQPLEQGLALLEGPELADCDTRLERAFILLRMGESATDRDKERRLYERSLALYRELGNQWWAAQALYALGYLARREDDSSEAIRRLEESATIYRTLGDPRQTVRPTWQLGLILAYQGQDERAERLGRESLALYRELGDPVDIGGGLVVFGSTLVYLGKYDEAHSRMEEGEVILSDLGLRRLLSDWIYMLGFAKMHLGRYQEARAHAQSTLALAREFGSPAGLAVSHCTLGCVALVEGAYVEAHRLGQQYLAINRERKRPGFLAEALANLAYATRALGNHRQAERISLRSGADSYRDSSHLSAPVRVTCDCAAPGRSR